MPHKTISFSLNGMLFEYDEEKTDRISKSTGSRSEVRRVSFLTLTELSFTMKPAVPSKTDMIRSEIPQRGIC